MDIFQEQKKRIALLSDPHAFIKQRGLKRFDRRVKHIDDIPAELHFGTVFLIARRSIIRFSCAPTTTSDIRLPSNRPVCQTIIRSLTYDKNDLGVMCDALGTSESLTTTSIDRRASIIRNLCLLGFEIYY